MTLYSGLTEKKIHPDDWLKDLAAPDIGSMAVFYGLVRNHPRDALPNQELVVALLYEAYIEMAQKMLQKIGHQTLEQFSGRHISLVHRLGWVPVGEISLLLGFSSYYSDKSFAGLQFCLREIKSQVPIWKKELFANGEARWIAHAPKTTA